MLDRYGDHLPIGTGLAESIWPIAFGDERFDGTALTDVYQAANSKSPTLLQEQLERIFTVDRESLPERYQTWFSLPWHRIYTLNIDDADEALSEINSDLQLQIISALSSRPGEEKPGHLPVIHVNGRLREFPNVTFSPWEFADQTVDAKPWYQEFAADVATRPVVIVGSIVDEPPLWHFMRLRERLGQAREVRPRSWLVTPSIDRGRASMLSELNFIHLAQTEEEFFKETIEPNSAVLAAVKRAERSPDPKALVDVAAAVREAAPGTADYLLGESPNWGDVTTGFAASFEFDEVLHNAVTNLTEGVVSVRGSASSGKTTSLMREAARLAAHGSHVLWLGRENELSVSELRKSVIATKADYLFIDDLDRFGSTASALLTSLCNEDEAMVVVTAARSSRYYALKYDSILPTAVDLEQTKLTDADAEALLHELDRGKRLGALRSMSHRQRILQLTKRNDRQLIVTLIEATSGKSFHEKIADECRGLEKMELALYGVACTAAWADNKPLSTQNLLVASGAIDRLGAVKAIQRLESARLFVKGDVGYGVRHRVVAESAIDYFRDEGLISTWIDGLIFLAASNYDPKNVRSSRLGRMLIRLISHQNLRSLVSDNQAVGRIYGSAEALLGDDLHFWLQRGSYELDFGDLRAAKNFLEQARTIDPADVLVATAWAQLQLKTALDVPGSPGSVGLAQEAIESLTRLMQRPNIDSPHTFSVFLTYSFRWLRAATLGAEEERRLRELILDMGDRGNRLYPNAPEVQQSWERASKWIRTNPMIAISY